MASRKLNAIRKFRLARAKPLDQADLGTRIGTTQSEVSAYELGKTVPELPKAFDIANALGRRVEEVFWQLHQESLERIAQYRDSGEV